MKPPYLGDLNTVLVSRGLLGLGIVAADGKVALREGAIAAWMPEPGRSIAECPLLSSVRDDLTAMDAQSAPLVIPDFTVAGFSQLGKLTVTLASFDAQERSIIVLTSLARRDNLTQQVARTKVREQDMLEERMLAATREIERMNRQLEQFASVAAHDLQAPVRQITSLIGFLKQECGENLTPSAHILLENMGEVLARMRSQIDGLHEYSRTSSQPLLRTRFNLAEAVDGALSNLTAAITESGATVETNRLPDFNGSKPLLISVFQNLVSNAIKYRSDAAPLIGISCHEETDRYQIVVTDNGAGIDPAHSETVFKLFSRGYPRVAADGIGIGLALCRQIIARHGGTIRHDPDYAEGTRMVIELPKARDERRL